MHAESESEQGLERLGGFGEGALEGEPLGPILDDVGEISGGKPQCLIEGGEFDLLALRAVP